MSTAEWIQIGLYLAILLLCAKPLGAYMAEVYEGRIPRPLRFLGSLERLFYRICGVQADEEMNWKQYATAMLWFHLVGFVALYGLQRVQAFLPLNPAGLGAVSPDSSFNTSVSFVTNTNWQGYGGETTLSYLTQMLGLTVQNFVSAAAGMAVLIALIRGFVRHQTTAIGNYWVDLTRSTLYILMPLSVVLALILVSQGVVQTLKPYQTAAMLQPTSYERPKLDDQGQAVTDAAGQPVMEQVAVNEQVLAVGPAASQIAIKQLGTNGGGFFNVNSAHPFENSTPLSNFLQVLSILLIPAALCCTFGKMVKDTRQGWALLAAMTVVLVAFLGFGLWSESHPGPASGASEIAAGAIDGSAGNMEGKETRFGMANSVLWATTTTAASNGSVNSMHDSYTPLGGLVPTVLMQLGEVIFGGVGSGLYGMIVFVVVTVFIAGLMVGRTPEYLGKKIEAFEMKMASIAVLAPCLCVLIGTAIAVMTAQVNASMSNPLPHGFSQVLYAFSSASNNNGSAFAGFGANNPTMNLLLGLAMLMGRFWVKIPVIALAGALAGKKYVPVSAGTLPTHTPLFAVLLIGVVLIVGALTFVPALALGPIAEHVELASTSSTTLLAGSEQDPSARANRIFKERRQGSKVAPSIFKVDFINGVADLVRLQPKVPFPHPRLVDRFGSDHRLVCLFRGNQKHEVAVNLNFPATQDEFRKWPVAGIETAIGQTSMNRIPCLVSFKGPRVLCIPAPIPFFNLCENDCASRSLCARGQQSFRLVRCNREMHSQTTHRVIVSTI